MKNGMAMLLIENTLGSWISLFVLLLLKLRGSLQGIVRFCVPCNSDTQWPMLSDIDPV